MTRNTDDKANATLLDANEVASRLNLSTRTVRRLIAQGEIRVVRIGRAVRVLESDLEEAVARWRG